MGTSSRTDNYSGMVLVAIDGSAADHAVTTWAAEEARQASRSLVIIYAAGHLPPDLTYAEREIARKERLAEGRLVTARAAQWACSHSPNLSIGTCVRLLEPSAIFPAVAHQARTLAQSADSWSGPVRPNPRAPVLVGHPATAGMAGLLIEASDYARRHGTDMLVVEGHGTELCHRIIEQSQEASLVFLPQPDRQRTGTVAWPLVRETLRRSASPVVLIHE